MTIQGLLVRLHAADVRLRARDGDLVIAGRPEKVDASLIDALRVHKATLLDMMGDAGDAWWSPPPLRPESFPLVPLTQAQLDAIVAGVPGGAANVQDIYPLAPLQEGILFHHLMGGEGDPYLLAFLYGFESRGELDRYLGALQAVVDRHDILRTAVVWDGLPEPVQVVWREAPLPVDEVELDPADGDAAKQLYARFDPRHHRIDVRAAPMLRAHVARDPAGDRWLLLLLRHHLISDHQAQEVLRTEIEAHLAGRADSLPPPLPFRNLVAQARLGVSREEQREFFTELLGDVDEPTAPFGLLDVRGDGTGIEEARIPVERQLAARLRERARALGVSVASVFHVAWARVLARASGRDDVVFGTVLFGRMQGVEGADRTIGPFINTLPVRIRVAGEGVEASVRQTHALLARLLRHEHASLALAQRCSGVGVSAPLFTALLNYRHTELRARKPRPAAPVDAPRGAIGGMRSIHAEERSNYPLTLSVDDVGEMMALTVKVRPQVGARRVCALMHTALEGVVEALETAPERPVGSIEVLPESERALVLEEWNRTGTEYPAESCVHQLFEARAERTPGAEAVVFEGERLTYAELNARANRLAHHLRSLGVGPDVRVAVCVERGLEMVVALLALLKAGGAYVALDPEYPEERLRYMLEDSRPAVLLAHASLAGRFADTGVPVIALDADAPLWADGPETNPQGVGVGPEHLVYVIYTSGSTGRPKGVLNVHRNLVNRIAGIQARWRLEAHESVLQNASLSFDVSAYELFWPLMMGARVVLARPEGHKDPGYLVETIRRNGIGTASFVPSMLQLFLEHPQVESCASLVRVPCGGEALPAALARRLYERLPHATLYNRYGPSEAATAVTGPVRGDDESAASVPIGRPMPNARAYVLDRAGHPVPVGVPGELCIGGAGVGRGYLRRPGLTAERFAPDPFAGEPGARLYRTGDLARWLSDGTLEFLGRTDFQVKVRGFRIELGEIEARLREHPAVREAVVAAREDTPGDRRLVAYYVGVDGAAEVEALRAHLGERLPEYMVPAAYVRLEQVPLTPSGKMDRKALPAPEGDAYATREYEPPVGETEAALSEIWAEVLRVERVGRWDHFFELGGHSLLAVQVISRVRQALEVEVELGQVFNRPVLKDFARELETAARAELPPVQPAPREGRVPLSFAQQRLWFLEQLGGLGSTYHIRKPLRMRGELDRAALARALDGIVARHEALRTTFAQVDGVPEQRIAPADAGFRLAEHDLEGRADARAELVRLTAEETRAPFDLERGPLIRGLLIRLAADDHLLLLTMHHIVSDGWSVGVLTRELTALYQAFRRGEPDPLPPLPVQYADYAVWQRRWVEGRVLQQQADYWARTLGGAPELLELPTDHPRPARVNHAGSELVLVLDEELTAGLRALGRRHGTTLFITLLAGWAAVLSRLSGQDDVVIGTPTANRGRREIEGLIGFFVNTLALRVDLSAQPTVAELLGRVKKRALEAQHNQDISFEQVVERLDPVRSLSHSPLFQAMFSWQDAPRDGAPSSGAEPEGAGPESSQVQAKFDLSLFLREMGNRIAGTVTYATALFERETVERHVGYLRRVLAQMVADESRPVERLALLPPDERARVLEEWNGPVAAYPSDACVHQLFEAQVRRTPGAEAVVFEGERLTYAELNARANRLAHHLQALGVGPDVPVGICAERSLEMVVGLLAVLKAGGGYVPLDPSYPVERLEYMLADSAPAAVLVQTALRDRVANARVPVLELDAAAPPWAGEPDHDPERGALAPGHLAYMTYTSGSTGRPKGVANPHRGSVNRLAWFQERHGLEAGEGVLQNSSFSFDASVFEIFWPLAVGGRLVLPRPEGHKDPDYLIRVISGENVSTAYFVCSMLQLFLEYPGVERCTALTRVLCGGEALSPALAQKVRERLPRVRLHNLYGPTESAVSVSGPVAAGDEAVGSVPIGRPVPNVRVYLLDAWGEPVPVGVAGELHVGGAQLARGYQGRPALTAERFVADPHGREPGARLYRTGDLGRWRRDGRIEFLGRMDFQVKVRGFRIEPEEIEERLTQLPGVEKAVVLAREDTPGDTRLVAYWVGDPVDAETLRAHLGEALPAYMVPSAYVRLEEWPLTPNGKLDRKALPAPEGDAFAAREYEAPEGEAEAALAEIWAEVLRVERVGRWDSFFELGGHSLLAVQVISRVRQVLEVEVALGELFTRPVLRDFARELETAARSELPPIEPAPREGRVPLSFAQQRLWFLEQMGDLGGTYHIRRRLPLPGELDRGALLRALDAIVARHEALRTTFTEVDGVPGQRIAPAVASRFHLVEHDLAGRADAAAELGRVMADEAHAPFDLERGPLIRGRLVRLAPDDHQLLVTMHHVVSDGWSMGVFIHELVALYRAFRAGQPDPLPPLPVQYADYALWQRRWIAGDVLQRQADYWTRTLAGAPELLELPTDHPRPAQMDHAGARVGVVLDESLTTALKALSRRHGTTLFMTVLAGWATVLSRLSGQDDVVIGTPTAGRGRREIEGLIGFFINTLALRMDLAGAPTVAELLGRVKQRALEAQNHQDIPFEQVVELVQPVRSLSHTPLFQVMFVWQDTRWGGVGRALAGVEEGGDAAGVGADSSEVQAKFDLSLGLGEREGRITGTVEYAASLFERETVERYVSYLRRVLEEMVTGEHAEVARLPLLPPAERRLVVEEWNDTDAGYPRGACVHDLFHAQAARTPNAVALSWRGERATYAELEAQANRISHALRRRGVGPEVRVGICLPRTPDLVAAMLGVLGAGGAYVPLDPAYPRERLGYMLEDAAISLVITDSTLADRLPEDAAALLLLDAERDAIAGEPSDAPESGVVPENLSHVIFTSGSTGRPKGVMIRHSSVVVLLHWLRENVTDEERASVLFSTSINFDVSVAEVFGTLAWGGKLVIAENALELATLDEDVVHVSMVPSAAAELLRSGGIPACVKTLNLGGEALPSALAQGLYALDTVEKVGNLYGPTEDTTYSTYYVVPRGASEVLVGKPVANTRAYVLDRHLQPVPIGAVGELYLAGEGLSRGYANHPAMTAERFIPCPFGPPGARMYRVMDRIRRRADGELEYLGRIDFQVKVRGYRIELGEIEARLAEHPGVRAPVVLVREDMPGDRRLVAYYLADGPAEVDALKAHLADRLPEYMVPAAYVWMEAYPQTPNGKVDRKALPAPEGDAYASRVYEEPVGETETVLAGIWSEVLGAERVGRWDNFFELGGHSLLAVQVISRVRQALQVEVSLGEVFTRPVLADFAGALRTAARAELPPIEPADRAGRVPLSFAQQRLWFLEQMGDLGSTYHIRAPMRLRGELDRDALVRALDAIVARHEVLRTTFVPADGIPEQRIAPVEAGGLALAEHDLAGRVDARAELGRLMAEETRTPFDLARGPLIRGRLVRLAPDDHLLLLTMHHIVSDDWSMGVLTHELSALYAAFRRGEPDPLAALKVQYADYAVWQRKWVEGQVLQQQAEYWARTLAGAPELLELPTDRPRPAQMDHAGARVGVVLDEELTAGLRALGRRHGTTEFMTLLAGWAVVLSRLAGQDDLVVGTPTANRGRKEIEGLIGFFVNTLALRLDLSGAPTVAELLGRVKERALEAQHHQDIPFEQVVELVDPARSLSHTPLFQVLFAWQNTRTDGLSLPGLETGGAGGADGPGVGSARAQAKFDLSLSLRAAGDRMVGEVTYATALFDQATVERFVGYLRRVLEEMARDEHAPVARLALLPPAERRLVVEEWNDTDAGYPRGACVHDLFRAQAARTPHAVALSWRGERLTYAELEARANRISHALRRRGVGPEIRVGICLPRTPDLVAAMLGALGAGGAYVPLDPAYPRERLGYMLEDAEISLVITDSNLADRLPDDAASLLLLDRERDAIAAEPTDAPESGVAPENLSHVIFTSGSTGRPKGVMIRHSSVVVLLHWLRENVTDEERASVLFSTSINFDVSVAEVFGTLAWGGKLVIAENALELATLDEDVVHVSMVPSAAAELLRSGGIPACVKTLNLGGEALPNALARGLYALDTVEKVGNLYGPTEDTTYSTYYVVPRGASEVLVGRPVANTRAYVLDRHLQPVPIGAVGELYLAGEGLSRGYANHPAMTAERFVPCPFGPPGARMYRVMDRIRRRADGELEYLGRIDFQVKVRGYRIELGEIEARLAEHPGVRAPVVLVREDTPGDRRLVAYYLADQPAEVDALKAHLSDRLPEYMVPAAYVWMEAYPQTPNGKVDRKALPAPEGDAYSAREFEPPMGEIEEALAEIWVELLGVERVGRWDSFFDLGGHSLLAVQVVSRVRQVMEVEISLGAVFETPVLSELADRILDLQLARFDPETLARLAQQVREPGEETAPALEEPG